MNVTVTSKIDFSEAMKKIESDEFWKFAAHEWWRCYYDIVPHDTNNLRNQVKVKPKEIEHFAPYAAYIYFGMKMVDPKYKVGGFTNDNGVTWWSRPGIKKVTTGMPLKLKNGSKEWDKKAKQEKKDLILIRSMQKWIDQNL